jgi:hypothetical protein
MNHSYLQLCFKVYFIRTNIAIIGNVGKKNKNAKKKILTRNVFAYMVARRKKANKSLQSLELICICLDKHRKRLLHK